MAIEKPTESANQGELANGVYIKNYRSLNSITSYRYV